ncbi:MAG: right-handed parallel beta-helix repeat-containing protein, partial [Myxococcota bacterium]
AERRDEQGRAGLARWAHTIIALERAVFGPFNEIEMAQRRVLGQAIVRALWGTGDGGQLGFGPRAAAASRNAAFVLRRDWGVSTPQEARALFERYREGSGDANAAWHWGTIAGAAEFAYQAYLCTAEEAWAMMCTATRALQADYPSWRHYAEAYMEKRDEVRHTGIDDEDRILEQERLKVQALLDDPRWSWSQIPWETPVATELPVPVAAPGATWNVTNADELTRALKTAFPGDVIRLAPGTYRGAFHPSDRGFELVGEPGVILEAAGDEPALSTFAGISLRSIELRATGTVIVNCGVFLRLEDCRVLGGDDGLQSYSDDEEGRHDYEVQLVDCTFEDTGDRAVVIEDGHALLLRTRILRPGGHGLTTRARSAGAWVCDCEVVEPGGAGVRAFGSPAFGMEEVSIRNAGGIGIVLAKGSQGSLRRVVVRGSAGRGVLVKDGSSLLAEDCRILDSEGANVDLADCAPSVLHGCELRGGEWGSVYLHPGGGSVLQHCRILGAKLACVFVDGTDSRVPPPRLIGCEIGESREASALFLANGARLRLSQTTLRDTPMFAAEVAGSQLDGETLSIERCEGGIIAHSDAQVSLSAIEVTGCRHSGLITRGSHARVDGLLVRGGLRGIVAGESSTVIATRCAFSGLTGAGHEAPDEERAFAILVGESSRLTLLGGSILGDGEDDAIQVITDGCLVADGLSVMGGGYCGIRVVGARLHLVGGDVRGSSSAGILLDGRATATLLNTAVSGSSHSGVEVRGGATLLVRDAKLKREGEESSIFGHDGARIVVVDSSVEDIAVEGDATIDVRRDLDGVTGLLADLVAAIAGPALEDAKRALHQWQAERRRGRDGLDRPGEEG